MAGTAACRLRWICGVPAPYNSAHIRLEDWLGQQSAYMCENCVPGTWVTLLGKLDTVSALVILQM